MASLGSSTRSAARATFSAYRRLPIRWRLAGGSAALTFVILAAFAGIVGVLTDRVVGGQFNDQVRRAADELAGKLNKQLRYAPSPDRKVELTCPQRTVSLSDYASAEHAQIRIYDQTGGLSCQQGPGGVRVRGVKQPLATSSFQYSPAQSGTVTAEGYRAEIRTLATEPQGTAVLLYARPLSDVDHTIARVRGFLVLGVLGGTVLALLAGLATAQRAMSPIRQLTEAAGEIERTRDPSRHLPRVEADDEVAELARTLEGMLQSLDSSRNETEALLSRQREFVADASHELRTPLTSVLANLELLAEELDGEQAETAEAALRSTRRMRRLVGDLLLLARADAESPTPVRPTDLADVLLEAAAEIGPIADQHELTIDAHPAVVAEGIRDDLHRLILNLLENALNHTPPGTHIQASTATENGNAVLTVEDDGPGIPVDVRQRLFERFVRGGRDGARGSGLGLSIVRAVARSHGGSVDYELPEAGRGTRFVIRIPAVPLAAGSRNGSGPEAQTSTTTGRTIGRRRSRS